MGLGATVPSAASPDSSSIRVVGAAFFRRFRLAGLGASPSAGVSPSGVAVASPDSPSTGAAVFFPRFRGDFYKGDHSDWLTSEQCLQVKPRTTNLLGLGNLSSLGVGRGRLGTLRLLSVDSILGSGNSPSVGSRLLVSGLLLLGLSGSGQLDHDISTFDVCWSGRDDVVIRVFLIHASRKESKGKKRTDPSCSGPRQPSQHPRWTCR